MWKYIVLSLSLLAAAPLPARDKLDNWIEVRSQHFTVVTNANEKAGRRIAGQFERMRSVFHKALPHVSLDNGSPVIVVATKDEKDFRTLEPQSYLAKGQLKLGGLFLRTPDKNYVLMRVEAEGEHPYAVIYHEYTHFLLSKAAEFLPLWLNEGLAEFYENTDIHEKEVALGQPSVENLRWLRQNRLLPLATLFAVDINSPYYHDEDKGSIFYAESWALTHYLYVRDIKEKTGHLSDYLELLSKKIDPVTAATQSFGDLKQLQSTLESYIRQGTYTFFHGPITNDVDDAAFKVQALTPTQADAVRADFLAYNDRVADARSLLDHVLQEDPVNVSAHETMGFLEFRAGHIDEARQWYEKAVKLDSQSYVAHYYFAAISMNDRAHPGDDSAIESSLRAAIKLNPSFAPPFERLAAFEGERRRSLEEAHMLVLTAVTLDPGNVNYRITTASVLIQMDRSKDAIAVLHGAMRLAKTPQETMAVQNFLTQVENFTAAREQQAQENRRTEGEMRANGQADAAIDSGSNSKPAEPEEIPKGPHHFLVGTLRNVRCHAPGIDLAVDSKGKTTPLHNGNYYKIAFSALGFTPKGELNPCSDLEGKPAKIEYIDSPTKLASAYVVAIELHK